MIDPKYRELMDLILKAAETGELALIETARETGEQSILLAIIYREGGDYIVNPIASMLDPENPIAGFINPACLAGDFDKAREAE